MDQRNEWVKEFNAAVTVCDRDGIILEMNDTSLRTFAGDGGEALLGTQVLDCHPEPSRTQLQTLLEYAGTHVYTIEKNGVKKLIYQAPWYRDGAYMGLVELSLPLPETMPHFIRAPEP